MAAADEMSTWYPAGTARWAPGNGLAGVAVVSSIALFAGQTNLAHAGGHVSSATGRQKDLPARRRQQITDRSDRPGNNPSDVPSVVPAKLMSGDEDGIGDPGCAGALAIAATTPRLIPQAEVRRRRYLRRIAGVTLSSTGYPKDTFMRIVAVSFGCVTLRLGPTFRRRICGVYFAKFISEPRSCGRYIVVVRPMSALETIDVASLPRRAPSAAYRRLTCGGALKGGGRDARLRYRAVMRAVYFPVRSS